MRKRTKTLLFVFLLFVGTCAILSIIALVGLPSLKTLEGYQPSLSSKLYSANGSLITELGDERRTLVNMDEVPADLTNAIIAIEDERFYHHHGIDFRGITRAVFKNITRVKLKEGASTITQQLARSLFLNQKKKLIRKMREAVLALEIERRYNKEQILELYMNKMYFGRGAYGVAATAQIFLGKHVNELKLHECAFIAGLLNRPSYYTQNLDKAISRQKVVLRLMKENNFITEEAEKYARKSPLVFSDTTIKRTKASYFVEYIKLQLEDKYGPDLVYKGGLSIYTTLDLKMQMAAEEALRKRIEELREQTKITDLNGALIAMDPATGEIKALVGGYDFQESQLNRAIQSRLQPGSAFKPLIYLAAMDRGYTPDDTILDTEIVYYTKQREWKPKNYYGEYKGEVTLRTALAKSLNVATIRLLEDLGPENVIPYAMAAGIESPMGADLSLALGTYPVTPIELTRAYSTIANLGVRTEPYAIRMVKDSEGRILEENSPKQERTLNPEACALTTDLMRSVVETGTAQLMGSYGFRYPCAGKTGTTDEFKAAWFAGFTPDLVATVYIGSDCGTTMGDRMSGAVVAMPVWAWFMKKVYEPDKKLAADTALQLPDGTGD